MPDHVSRLEPRASAQGVGSFFQLDYFDQQELLTLTLQSNTKIKTGGYKKLLGHLTVGRKVKSRFPQSLRPYRSENKSSLMLSIFITEIFVLIM